jgi:hypothetical protein
MTDRRFNEAEVEAIFELATKSREQAQGRVPSPDGMTLAQLQDIAREVGIAPTEIARAAMAVEQGTKKPSRTFMGLPTGVERTIPLEKPLSEEEWDRLVGELRETFDARGVVKREGSIRLWANGNLHAYHEPTASGYRLRLRTVKGGARERIVGGLGILGAASAALGVAVLSGAVGDTGMLVALASLGTAGAAMFGLTAFRLPSWARLRQQQMDDLAVRLSPETRVLPENSEEK